MVSGSALWKIEILHISNFKKQIDFFLDCKSGYAFQLVDKTGTLREDKNQAT